jgi:hypothetical protein
MKRTASVVLAYVLAAMSAGIPAWAHHSFAAAYDTDMNKRFTVQGTIIRVRLTNPHSWFYLDVKNATTGKNEEWSFEAGTPSGMIRNGYKAEEMKPGMVVTINASPARDATLKVGMLRELITADGKRYGMFGPQEGPGAR